MSEVAVYEGGRSLVSAADLRNQVNAIQQAMQAVMKEGTHYGKIPGTPKPTLYKAGSEVLLTMFHISVEPQVEDLSDGDHIRYRVKTIGKHQASGIVLGVGIGEASTAEEKYAWRRAVCDEEFAETDPTRRRMKFSRHNGKTDKTPQVRTNAADLANTVLKMAKKRAQIDLTLTVTAASDIFTQDVEDLPPELQQAAEDAPTLDPNVEADLMASLDEATDTEDLRTRLQKALAIAHQGGDVDAHKRIKAKGIELAGKLAAKAVQEPTEGGEPAAA